MHRSCFEGPIRRRKLLVLSFSGDASFFSFGRLSLTRVGGSSFDTNILEKCIDHLPASASGVFRISKKGQIFAGH